MSDYSAQNALYRDVEQRGRIEMCASEQAQLTYAGETMPDGTTPNTPENQALAFDVIAGNLEAIDSLTRIVCTGPNWAQLDEDDDLTAAMQTAWPVVAAARTRPAQP